MKKDALALGALILSTSTPQATSFAGSKALQAFKGGGFDFGFGFEGGYIPLPDDSSEKSKKNYNTNKPTGPSPEELKKIKAEKVSNMNDALIDAVSLSSAPSRNYGIFEDKLAEQGYFISKVKGDKKDNKSFKLTTPEGPSYIFKPLAEVEKKGFMARSMAVHELDKDGNAKDLPSSVRIAFGRITPLEDIPKTFLKPSTGLPIEDKMSVKELIYKTRFNHYDKYSKPMYEKDVVVSTFSEDSKHGLYCFDECKKQGIKTDLRRFNPNSPKIPTDLIFDHIMANQKEKSLANIATGLINGNITNYKNDNFQVFESEKTNGGILNNIFGSEKGRSVN